MLTHRHWVLVLLLLASGCGGQKEPGQKEPVDLLKEHMAKLQNSLDGHGMVYQVENKKGWKKSDESISNIQYDVKKTDSVVSPFAGLLTFDRTLRVEDFPTNCTF